MNDLISQALSYLQTIVSSFAMTIANSFLSLFPDYNSAVMTNIHIFFNNLAMPTGGFNFLYFINWSVVAPCISIFSLTLIGCVGYKFIRFCVSLIHDLIDSIPVIG